MALNKGIWDPKLRGTNIKGTNLKSLRRRRVDGMHFLRVYGLGFRVQVPNKQFRVKAFFQGLGQGLGVWGTSNCSKYSC